MSQREQLSGSAVHCKRNPRWFLQHLPEPEKQKSLDQLRSDYRTIILSYFHEKNGLSQKIDQFVKQAFLLDISVSQIIEIHMELMDAFGRQLKLEGRNKEILLDYRLTLIDIIAHLGEIYRCSIPRS